MNLFADLLASTKGAAVASPTVETGPRIQKGRRGVEIKSAREIDTMRKASRIVATVLREILELAAPGMSTGDLDRHAEKRIREMGATPSFKGYHGFPASICASINNEVVHGIPNSKRVIQAGDLVKIDTGAYFDGYHGDSCVSLCVGEDATEEAQTWPRSRRATHSSTSLERSKTTSRPTVLRWWRTTRAMEWAEICTRSPRCSTSAPEICPT